MMMAAELSVSVYKCVSVSVQVSVYKCVTELSVPAQVYKLSAEFAAEMSS